MAVLTACILCFCTPLVKEATFAGTGQRASMTAKPMNELSRAVSLTTVNVGHLKPYLHPRTTYRNHMPRETWSGADKTDDTHDKLHRPKNCDKTHTKKQKITPTSDVIQITGHQVIDLANDVTLLSLSCLSGRDRTGLFGIH